MVSLLVLGVSGMSALRIVHTYTGRPSSFDLIVPSLVSAGALLVSRYAVINQGNSRPFLAGAIALAGAYFFAAFRLRRRHEKHRQGSSMFAAFVFAGSTVLAVSLSVQEGLIFFAGPVLSVVAFFVASAATRYQNQGAGFAAYATQLYANGIAIYLAMSSTAPDQIVFAQAAAAFTAVVTIQHYRYRRGTAFGGRGLASPADELASWAPVLLLASGLISGFSATCCTLYFVLSAVAPQILAEVPITAVATAILNIGAFAAMVVGFFRRSTELRNVAIFFMGVGGMSVLLELVTLHGIARLVSVFGFGIAAALASAVLTKWPSKSKVR
jgi:hypothetical protein